MNALFIDSSALVALNDDHDSSHIEAIKILREISPLSVSRYISTNVILETITIVSQRLGKREAVKLLGELRSGNYTVVHPDEGLIREAEDIFQSVISKNVSYSDCVSFSVMRRYGIQWVFSFDLHFKKQGFKRVGVDR